MADGGAILRTDPAYAAFDKPPDLTPTATPPAAVLAGPASPLADGASALAAPAQPQTDPKLAELQKSLHDTKTKYEESLLGAERTLNGIAVPSIAIPKMPQVQQTTPAQAWGSAAMMLATVGSLFTRQPLTTAMNAMAGVLKGFREADQQSFDNTFKVWQQASSNALALGSFQMQAYHAALSGLEEKLALGEKIGEIEQRDAIAKISATGAALGDQTLQTILQNEGLPGTIKYVTDMVGMWTQFQKSQNEAMSQGLAASAMKEWLAGEKAAGHQVSAQLANSKWKEFENQYSISTDITPDALTQAAQQELAGDHSWKTNLGRGIQGPANIAAVLNKEAELRTARGQTGSDAAAATAKFGAQKAEASAAGRRLGVTVPSVIEAEKFADQALQASADVSRGQFVPLNQAEQMVQRGTSSPEMAKFVVANTSLVQAYAAAVSRTGVPTDKLREHAYGMLETAMSQEAYAAAISQMRKELALARDAPQEFLNQLGDTIGGRGAPATDAEPSVSPTPSGGDGWSITPVQ